MRVRPLGPVSCGSLKVDVADKLRVAKGTPPQPRLGLRSKEGRAEELTGQPRRKHSAQAGKGDGSWWQGWSGL
jgi:hypothetical protein